MIIEYPLEALEYLKKKDKRLSELIDRYGVVHREGSDGDVFADLVRHIIGQQISNKALSTVLGRFQETVPAMTAEGIASVPDETLQQCGMTMKKVGYIKSLCEAVQSGALPLDALDTMDDEAVIQYLTALPGIGRWTAEMVLIFTLHRLNVLSTGDLAIQKGLKRLYHHKELPKARLARYKKRYSPYGTVAAFYLWKLGNE